MTVIHVALGLAASTAGLRANMGMIRRRWLSDQPGPASEGRRGRLIGQLALMALSALAGYLAGRRTRKD